MIRPSDPDRIAILRRRSRFVGSALLTLTGCGAGTSNEPPRQPPAVTVPESEAVQAEESVPPRSEQERPDPMPPLEVPADAIGVALGMYESLARHVPPIHLAIDRLGAELPPSCDLSQRACEQAWQIVAARIEELAGDVAGLAPVCPGSSDDARRYERRVRQHQQYAMARLAALERDIERRLGTGSRFRALREASARAQPMVCLDCNDW